jgi:hypothetical protein
MRYYADAVWPLDSAWVRATTLDGLPDGARAANRSSAIERAREGLIAAGMAEQALADAAGDTSTQYAACSRLTDLWADRLATAWNGTPGSSNDDLIGRSTISGDALNDLPAAANLPEGYLFYGLFPDQYLDIGRRLRPEVGDRPAMVVGVRSIGTSLSAAVAAGLRSSGCDVSRATVRPEGDPFNRMVEPSAELRRAFRGAAARGAAFFAVDEGPGLSGSSLAATVMALVQCGATPDAITLVCAARGTMPMAGPTTRSVWRRCPCWAADDHGQWFWHEQVPRLIGEALGARVGLLRDLSWGAWVGDHAPRPPLAHLERRKLLLSVDGTPVLAKFCGFGPVGRIKADRAAQIAALGYAPPVVGYAHGHLLLDWQEQRRSARPGVDAERVLPAATRYYAYLRGESTSWNPAPLDEIAETTAEIVRTWLGHAGGIACLAQQAAQGRPLALQGDQKPEAAEWLIDGEDVQKVDVADHFLDHSWARNQDVCFDLAGFTQEFDLRPDQERALVDSYAAASGDIGVWRRLQFYQAVFAAHRLAALDTAFHAAAPEDRQRIDVERQRMGNSLSRAAHMGGEADGEQRRGF